MPVFVTAVHAWARHRPGRAFLALLALGLVGYWLFLPAPPPVRATAARPPGLPGVGADKAVIERTLLDVQKSNEELRVKLEAQELATRQLKQAQASAEHDRQAGALAQEQQLATLRQQLQQAQATKTSSRPAPAPRPVAAPLARTAEGSTPPPPPPRPTPAVLQVLRHTRGASFQGPPPSPLRADTPFLPAGSFAEGRVITGVMATSRAGGALPMLLAVSKEFTAPFLLGGPGRAPQQTGLPIAGCFVLGKAAADLGASRVLVQLDLLSCVWPDGTTYEKAIKGYATDKDGTLGIVARVETHDSAVIAKAFLSSLVAGAGEAFASAKRTVQITPLGGQQAAVTGNVGELAGFSALSNAAAQLSQFYLQQASQLLPTLWLESNTSVRLVLQEGLALEGLPLTTTAVRGE